MGMDLRDLPRSGLDVAAEKHIDALESDIERLRQEVENLRFALDAFAYTAERAVEEHRRPKTGMQVPFHGDFAGAQPSVIGRLDWWARQFRRVLAGEKWG